MPLSVLDASETTTGTSTFAALLTISEDSLPVEARIVCSRLMRFRAASPMTLSIVLCLPISSEKTKISPLLSSKAAACVPPVLLKTAALESKIFVAFRTVSGFNTRF